MSQHESKKPLPKCKALLLCERCIIERGTERVSLINLFANVRCAAFPGRCPSFFAFVQLVDGIGRYRLQIEIRDLDENQVVARTGQFIVEFPVRPMKRTFGIPIRSLLLPHPGMFDLILLGDGEEIERQTLMAQRAQRMHDEI
jgi:hypothetical protein